MVDLIQFLREEISLDKNLWLLSQVERYLIRFQTEIHNWPQSRDRIVKSTLPNLLGIGEGSTPESDDLFLGIIATMKIKESSIRGFLSEMSIIKYEDYTTKKSAYLIRCFLRDNFPDELKEFTDFLALESQDSLHVKDLKSTIKRIKRIGASSGYTFLSGCLWQLQYYENHRQNLIVKF